MPTTIAVLGATGPTGHHCMTQAADRGLDVVAVARRPDAVAFDHASVEVREADVFEPEQLRSALDGVDVAVFAVGVSSILDARKETTVYSEGARNVCEAAAEVGVGHVVIVSSSGIEDKPGDPVWYAKVIKPALMSGMYEDMGAMESWVQQSSPVDWTLVRAPQLGDGPRTDRIRTQVGSNFADDDKLARSDLAAFLLDVAVEGRHRNEVVAVDVAGGV